jgi:hypothetical protein
MGFLRRLFGGGEPVRTSVETITMEPKHDDAWLDIVGEGSYQSALESLAGGKTPDGPRQTSHVATLFPEPENPHDANAIAVKIEGSCVGYFSREDAILYRPPVRSAASMGRMIACRARLIGGWDRGGGDVGSIGVRLHIGSPRECMAEINGNVDEGITVQTDHPWPGYLIAFTGDSLYSFGGMPLDRATSEELARRAGMSVHPRVTKHVQLLVDCDPTGISGNQRKAMDYGVPVVSEGDFWAALGVNVQRQ